jgi:hypothetical protein
MQRGAQIFPAVIAALLGVCVAARAEPSELYVIPPGQEPLVLAMVGGKDTLPGGCRLEGVNIDRTIITARYLCEGAAETALVLRHTAEGEGALIKTAAFAILRKEGAPPEGLVSAVAERVRAGEQGFYWLGPGSNRRDMASAPEARPSEGSRGRAAPEPKIEQALTQPKLFGLGVVSVGAIAWIALGALWLARRRKAAKQ